MEAPDIVSFNSTLGACDKGGQWRVAVALLEALETRSLEADKFTYSTIINTCGRSEEWIQALSLLDHAHLRGVAIDLVVLNTLVTACERAKEWRLGSQRRSHMCGRLCVSIIYRNSHLLSLHV
ncbi:unnamed protein product [Symbiodinium sp. KB8]|nr:unnamed protein product [Symbiodinium sp. KB8]